MPKGFPTLTVEQKQEVIKRIKEKGERVSELAKEYGVVPQTIYNLLARQAHSTGALLELAKVKRQNESLLKIIGQLVADQRLGKKIRRGRGN